MLDAYPGTTETSHSTNFSLEEGLNVTALKMEESYRRMMQNPKIISALKGQQVQVVGGEGRGDASVPGGGGVQSVLVSTLAWHTCHGKKVGRGLFFSLISHLFAIAFKALYSSI